MALNSANCTKNIATLLISILVALIAGFFTFKIEGLDVRATKCSTDDDCVIVEVPECITGGCSPPCGHIFNTGVHSVNKDEYTKILSGKSDYTKALGEKEKELCGKVNCMMCYGQPDVQEPFPTQELQRKGKRVDGIATNEGKNMAVCREHKCEVKR